VCSLMSACHSALCCGLHYDAGGHENKIMSCDVATPSNGSDDHYIATASYDRTWKLWGPDLLADLGI
jgi:hypothetical protein